MSLFIKEVLRLYPPVFTMARRLANPVTLPRGFGEDQFYLDDQPVRCISLLEYFSEKNHTLVAETCLLLTTVRYCAQVQHYV